jgi:hypothetical protein
MADDGEAWGAEPLGNPFDADYDIAAEEAGPGPADVAVREPGAEEG